MEWKVDYIEGADVLVGTKLGRFAVADEAAFLDELFGHPLRRPSTGIVIVFGELDIRPIGPPEMRRVVELFRRRSDLLQGTRIALCCTTTVQFGLGRQFQSLASSTAEISVFRQQEPALEWLATASKSLT